MGFVSGSLPSLEWRLPFTIVSKRFHRPKFSENQRQCFSNIFITFTTLTLTTRVTCTTSTISLPLIPFQNGTVAPRAPGSRSQAIEIKATYYSFRRRATGLRSRARNIPDANKINPIHRRTPPSMDIREN